MGHANKDGGGNRDKGLDFSERNFKRLNFFAVPFQGCERRRFGPAQAAWRQEGNVCSEMGKLGMQFLSELLDELSNLVFHIRDQRESLRSHGHSEIINTAAPPCRSAPFVWEQPASAVRPAITS